MGAVSIPAPVGGWNARDSLDAMKPTDAVRLSNWIPRASWVESRRGSSEHVNGLGGTVESVIPYRGTGGAKLLAAANGHVWNVTTAAAPSSLATGFASDEWQYANHSNRVLLVNGVDAAQGFDGTTLAALTITGVSATTLWGVNTFKGRAFYWAENAQSVWYAAAGSFQGALSEFNFAATVSSGGTLVQMLTWTLDAGDGVDDLAAFVFSTGEVLVYQGDDPGSAINWAKIGSFYIGEPIAIRGHARVANTEILATKDGWLDLAAALHDGRYSEKSAYSNKISRAAKDAAQRYAQFSGWGCTLYPAGNLFIVNIPISATESIQHVRETNGGGWSDFSGWNARCFAVHNDLLYFGTADGRVMLADTGINDDSIPIALNAVPAFSPLGSKAQRKQITAVSIISNYEFPAYWALDGLADFNTLTRATVQSDFGVPPSSWDTADWDFADWSADEGYPQAMPRAWRNLRASGYALTCSVRLNSSAQSIAWFSTGYLVNSMGAI